MFAIHLCVCIPVVYLLHCSVAGTLSLPLWRGFLELWLNEHLLPLHVLLFEHNGLAALYISRDDTGTLKYFFVPGRRSQVMGEALVADCMGTEGGGMTQQR